MMNTPKILDGICDRIYKECISQDDRSKVKVHDLKDAIIDSDKDLFIKLRDRQLTYDQLRARIAERKYNLVYKCLDDLKEKGILDPKYYTNMNEFKPFFDMIYSSNTSYKDVL